jgi:glyoxylase-like metal-dependent hydrolase (beta-lactamase superfamily II)
MPCSKLGILELRSDLYRIPLPVALDGFDDFISAWIYTGGPVAVVDVGPMSGAPHLLRALAEIGVRKLDLILLTHIHIDHAGGAGAMSRAFPRTPVVCHPQGAPHLIDPQRLWEGSLKTLGHVARAYGPMEPLPAARVLSADRLESAEVTAVETAGHAAHHYSYLVDDLLFAGEAGGVCIANEAGEIYMRPATPPRLFLETYLESIDRLIALTPQTICYGHIGWQTEAVNRLKRHRDQLLLWRDLLSLLHATGDKMEKVLDQCRQRVLTEDPLLAGFHDFPTDVQHREEGFLINSIKGYWGYLDDYRNAGNR